MLNEILFTKVEEEDIGNIWFEQDDATCRTAEGTLDVLRRILQKDPGMTPYKVQLSQKLKPINHPMRFRFAKWV